MEPEEQKTNEMGAPGGAEPSATGPVAVLCGSLNREGALVAAEEYYLELGYAVRRPRRDPSVSDAIHAERWYRLIDTADLVVIVTDPTEYVGEQTTRERDYALRVGKTVAQWCQGQPSVRRLHSAAAFEKGDVA